MKGKRWNNTNFFSKAGAALKPLFTPPLPVVVLGVPVIAALMAWVFLLGNEGSPLSYVAFVISAYLLIVLCIAFARCSFFGWLDKTLRRNEHVIRILDDPDLRRKIGIAGGLCIDIFWAAANLVFGVKDVSVWLITLGVYYLVFALARGLVLTRLHTTQRQTDETSYKIERICGALLLISTFVLSGIVTLTITGDGSFIYSGLLIYAVATYAFYALISSIVGFFRLRKHEDPLIVANARINLAIALVSLFALEIAMFSEFATEQDAALVFVMPILTGAVIAVILIIMGVHSIINASASLNSMKSKIDQKTLR